MDDTPTPSSHDDVTFVGNSGAGETSFEKLAATDIHAMPERIERYQIIQQIGEGGMGAVYLAKQVNPERHVALKVIKPGCATVAMLRRFEVETQVLAKLQHPGIAQIYDAGTIDVGAGAQPFFAMEYVEGVKLDQHADENGFDTRARLDLIARVCHAVQHAHQKGVVHRDLKPGNILVDVDGEPKILDFGVARATDGDVRAATMETDAGQLIGTLPYMSPEQVLGDPDEVDTRSDVYAIGVILYELLTGQRPLDLERSTVIEAARRIRDEDITPLTRHDMSLKGDIATIVHTALEKDRDRRYQTASDLAADIERALTNQPIAARPATALYQLSRFARRNRALVAAAVLMVLVLVAATAVSLWGLVQADTQRHIAETQRGEAEEQRRIAEDEATRARDALAQSAAMTQFLLEDVLKSADPAVTGGEDISVVEALDRASTRINTAFGGEPILRIQAHNAMGATYRALGAIEQASAQYDAAIALAEETGEEAGTVLLESRSNKAMALSDAGRVEEALALAMSSSDDAVARFGPDDIRTSQIQGNLATVLIVAGRSDEAEPMLRHARVVIENELGENDRLALIALHNLATAVGNQGRIREAAELLDDLLKKNIDAFGERHPDTLSTMNNLATNYTELNEYELAEPLLRRTVELREEVFGPDHQGTLLARTNLIHILIMQERREEALPLVRATLEQQEAALGPNHQNTLTSLNQLAYLLEDLGRLDEAETMHRDALDRWRSVGGNLMPGAMIALNNLAMVVHKRDPAEAEALFADLVEAAEEGLPPGHFYTGFFRSNQGACLTELRKYDAAEATLLRAYDLIRASLGPDHDRTQTVMERLVTMYEAWGRPDDAAPYRQGG